MSIGHIYNLRYHYPEPHCMWHSDMNFDIDSKDIFDEYFNIVQVERSFDREFSLDVFKEHYNRFLQIFK